MDSRLSIVYWFGFANPRDFLLVTPVALGIVTALLLLLFDLERESLVTCLLVSA